MSLRNKLSIEPLTEARWGRVERAVFRAVEHGDLGAEPFGLREEGRKESLRLLRWRSSTSFILAGAAAAAIGAFTCRTIVQKEVQARPTRVETAATGSRVEVGDSTVDVGPQSSVRVVGDDAHGVIVVLDGGRVEVDVAPRHDRPAFIVQAGPVEVRVVGTHFVVTRTGPAVTVDVQRGKVEVTSGELHTLVAAGAHWPPSQEGTTVPVSAPPPPEPPAATKRTVPAPAHASPSAPREQYESVGKLEARALSQREQYESASKLEAREPDAASSVYRELSKQGGKWGMNALFAEGRLDSDRGRNDEAAALLREYLDRYPHGPNAEDARRLLGHLP